MLDIGLPQIEVSETLVQCGLVDGAPKPLSLVSRMFHVPMRLAWLSQETLIPGFVSLINSLTHIRI